MDDAPFMDAVTELCRKDPRYDRQAYPFIREAIEFTTRMLQKPSKGTARHVTGQELLDGIRKYALQEFGPMARTVLDAWGIRTTRDFGEIVFNLVSAGKLGKTDEDTKEDFDDGYEFEAAFDKPFLPQSQAASRPASRRKRPRKSGPPTRRDNHAHPS